jgi:hypothetical protein
MTSLILSNFKLPEQEELEEKQRDFLNAEFALS